MRRRFPHFGPKKIKAWLEDEAPKVEWPAASTIGDILKRKGLIQERPRRRRAIAQGEVISPANAPNEEWSIDFKGWFRTADGTRCDPLDAHGCGEPISGGRAHRRSDVGRREGRDGTNL